MNIRITNLNLNTIDSDLRKLFSRYGQVNSAAIIRDKNNGRPNGSAVVDMVRDNEARIAIESLHHSIVDGKTITVMEID